MVYPSITSVRLPQRASRACAAPRWCCCTRTCGPALSPHSLATPRWPRGLVAPWAQAEGSSRGPHRRTHCPPDWVRGVSLFGAYGFCVSIVNSLLNHNSSMISIIMPSADPVAAKQGFAHALSPDDIVDKYREAIVHYSKVGISKLALYLVFFLDKSKISQQPYVASIIYAIKPDYNLTPLPSTVWPGWWRRRPPSRPCTS